MTGLTHDPQSFDPRRWRRETAPTPAPEAPAVARSSAPRLPRAALAGSAAILALGGIAAWLSKPVLPPAALAARPVAAPVEERRMLVLAGRDDLASALVASGIAAEAAAAAARVAYPLLAQTGEVRAAMTLHPAGAAMDLVRLAASNPDASGVTVTRGAQGFIAAAVAADLDTRVVVRRGTMDANNFYSSAVAAGVIDSLIPDFAKALSYDFDFQREVGKGDGFEAAFEQRVDADDRAVGPPTLLYASLTARDRTASAYRFALPGEDEASWYDRTGRPVKRELLRTPIDAARVSSGFGFRLHPVLGFMKLHKGTDFAAPTGTPILASGDATVEFAGPKGPNGNFVKLMHDNGWESLYLHMNAFAPGIAAGAHVRQGQQIGEVGTTGRSTGPHLHYELHVSGEAMDPLSIRVEAARPLKGTKLKAFLRERDRIDVSRARDAS